MPLLFRSLRSLGKCIAACGLDDAVRMSDQPAYAPACGVIAVARLDTSYEIAKPKFLSSLDVGLIGFAFVEVPGLNIAACWADYGTHSRSAGVPAIPGFQLLLCWASALVLVPSPALVRPGPLFAVLRWWNDRYASGLQENKSYSRFAFYAIMEHGGRFSEAAATLAREGYRRNAARSVPGQTPPHTVGDYRENEGRIEWCRRTKDTDVWVPLTNFTAGIVCDITMDDGVETTRALEIKAAINGKDLTFPVPAGQFA